MKITYIKSMNRNIILLLLIILFLLCNPGKTESYLAFSLREAQRISRKTRQGNTELENLGGITRIIGMVHDRDTEDLIVLGQDCTQFPSIQLDDLVVALRSRLIYDEWPTVSIDPTPESSVTHLQKVNFSRGMKDTRFGRILLDCDLLLKNYALGLVLETPLVKSYRFLCEENVRKQIENAGARLVDLKWMNLLNESGGFDSVLNHNILEEKVFQSRFWFYPCDTFSITEWEGVFVINNLSLGVRTEMGSSQVKDSLKDELGEKFSSDFTVNIREVFKTYSVLNHLPALYQLVAIAEAIGRIGDSPNMDYFLKDYETHVFTTSDREKLTFLGCLASRSDGKTHVIQISGGIEIKAILERLNAGDVSALKLAVIGSRPESSSLVWNVPLDGWLLQDMDRNGEKGESMKEIVHGSVQDRGRTVGCVISSYSFTLGKTDSDSNSLKTFSGFPPPPPPFPLSSPNIKYHSKLPSGVDMKMNIEEDNFESDETGNLKRLREKALENRRQQNFLTWPLDEKE
jgi:hypothetical protein